MFSTSIGRNNLFIWDLPSEMQQEILQYCDIQSLINIWYLGREVPVVNRVIGARCNESYDTVHITTKSSLNFSTVLMKNSRGTHQLLLPSVLNGIPFTIYDIFQLLPFTNVTQFTLDTDFLPLRLTLSRSIFYCFSLHLEGTNFTEEAIVDTIESLPSPPSSLHIHHESPLSPFLGQKFISSVYIRRLHSLTIHGSLFHPSHFSNLSLIPIPHFTIRMNRWASLTLAKLRIEALLSRRLMSPSPSSHFVARDLNVSVDSIMELQTRFPDYQFTRVTLREVTIRGRGFANDVSLNVSCLQAQSMFVLESR